MVDLDLIFRSIINFKDKSGKLTISQEDLMKNFRAMQQIIPEAPEDKSYSTLYHTILTYLKENRTASPEMPSYEYLQSYFESVEGNEAVLAVLEKIKVAQPFVGQDYRASLRMYNEDQNVLRLERVLSNTAKAASVGLSIGSGKYKRTLKGVKEALNYLVRETRDLNQDTTGVKTEAQIVSHDESGEIIEEYKKAERDPTESIGINTWLYEIDSVTNGLKNGELMLVAGFTAHCKTTFSLNMAYRALYGGWNTGYISLEMPFKEIRRRIYVLHASNPKFRDTLPQYAHLVDKISNTNVKYGRLTEEERNYFFEVCRDFDKNINKDSESYGRFYIWQPDMTHTTVSDIEFKMRQWQQELEMSGRKLEFVVVDYIGLLGADKEQRTRDHNETLNNIISSLKRLSMSFNNGQGVRILSPFQMNRAGYREALQNEGRYYTTALSNAHAAERDSDLVISTFKFNDENDSNRLKICCLKNRNQEEFRAFDACINFETGFIYNFPDQVEHSGNLEVVDPS